jgi:ligand-binding sensor domain-containing protein/signal transduction histidine kinase
MCIQVKFSHAFYWLLLLSISLSESLLAQTALEKTKFIRIQANNELSHSGVTCILQDSYGFLWIGTRDGLNRYDGYEFTIYRHDPQDSTSLLKNIILHLYEDNQKVLWVSTANGGLHAYDRQYDKFTRIAPYAYNCEISQIIEDDEHRLWIAGIKAKQAFCAQLDQATGKWREHIVFPSGQTIKFLSPASPEEFWIGVNHTGFFKWNWRNLSLTAYQADKTLPESIVSNKFQKGIKDDKGNLWLATAEGLSKFEVTTGYFTNYVVSEKDSPALASLINNVLVVCQDGPYIWIGTENGGLRRLDTRTQRFTNYLPDKSDPTSLIDYSIWALHKDSQNRIWIGTYSKGLCVIDKLQEKFFELDIPLRNDVVNALWQDASQRFWVGTEGGIAMKKDNDVHYFQHVPGQKGSLSSNPVLSIFEDSRHQMWFGTWAGGLNRYEERTNRFVHYLPDPDNSRGLSNPNIFSIHSSRQTGQLLVGTYNGLHVLTNEKTGAFEKYMDPVFQHNNYISRLYEDSGNNLWIGTIEELAVYDRKGEKIRPFAKSGEPGSVSGFINCITEDQKGRLWVGSTTGLYLLINRRLVVRYTTQDGLPSEVVNSILEDAKGNLWLSTNHGICRFDPEHKTFKNYDTSDGLLSNEFKPNACFKNASGQFFFGGKGVNVFYPDSIKSNPYVPAVYLTDLKLFNQSAKVGAADAVLPEHISQVREISLEPKYTFFSIHYVALNFTSSAKNQYAYRLEGFNQDWIYVGSQRSATFTNLDVGTYTFRVKASNNDGLWNEQGVALIIHVLPPWWKTWWFMSAASLCIIAAGIGTYRFRIRNIKQLNKKLEKLVIDRTKELQIANKDLLIREEEITSQNEKLSQQNEELNTAWKIIENQNKEILVHNQNLDQEVKERTKELVEYNRQLEQFAFIAAHNLRAPVARILGLGQILKLPQNTPDEEKMMVSKLILTTEALDQVVRDISTILEVRKNHSLTITQINLTEELRALCQVLNTEIMATQAKIVADFSRIEHLQSVKPYVVSILLNLLTNAIKYRHPARKPYIRISSDLLDGYVCLMVKDNGLGIDLEHCHKQLFTLYKRFHPHIEGKGMGLYLVKTQVSALNGKIEVESTVDSGTTFRIYLKVNSLVQEI